MTTSTRTTPRSGTRHVSRSSLASLLAAVALQAPLSLRAESVPGVVVTDAWVRATVPQQKASGAFMQITASRDMRLVGVRTAVAGIAEIHEMSMVDNMMQMRQIESVALPAGKPVDLKPGGYHVMLLDLKEQMKQGNQVALTLIVEDKLGKRQAIDVAANVRGLTATNRAAGAGRAP